MKPLLRRIAVLGLLGARILVGADAANSVITISGGPPGFAGDGGSAANGRYAFDLYGTVRALAMDQLGNLLVTDTDNNRIRQITPGGIVNTIAGSGGAGFFGDRGSALAASLYQPASVAVDLLGRVHIADSRNSRVRRINADRTIQTVVGGGTIPPIPLYLSGQIVSALQLSLDVVRDIAFDPQGRLYVSNSTQGSFNTFRVKSDGTVESACCPSVFDAQGNVYYPVGNRVYRNAVAYAGTGVTGFFGDGGPALAAQFSEVGQLALDKQGNLYIADTYNRRIRRVSPTGIVSTVVGNGETALGQLSTSTINTLQSVLGIRVTSDPPDGGPAGSARLGLVNGLVLDDDGNLYFSEMVGTECCIPLIPELNRIRKVQVSPGSRCSYSVTPTALEANASGGNFPIAIQTDSACSWTISGMPTWITVAGANSGTGPGSVTLAIGANTGAARNTVLSAAGVSVTVNQSAAPPPPPPTTTCSSVEIDTKRSNDVLDVTYDRSCDGFLTIRNNKNYWTNIQLSGSARRSEVANLYAIFNLLPPSGLDSLVLHVHFSKPNETISIFVDPTGQIGNGAKWMNVAQIIINVTPGLGSLPLLATDFNIISQAFAQMPHLNSASDAMSLSPPDFGAYLRELGLFIASPEEIGRFALMVGTVAANHAIGEKHGDVLTGFEQLWKESLKVAFGWPIRIAFATAEVFANALEFIFALPSGDVLLTAK